MLMLLSLLSNESFTSKIAHAFVRYSIRSWEVFAGVPPWLLMDTPLMELDTYT